MAQPESVAGEDPTFPINLLIYEMKSDDVSLRLNAMSHLKTIASALGSERTRRELIPYCSENLDDADEVLAVIAQELGSFVPYVGGPEYADVLLGPLELLATVDDMDVRQKVVDAINKICSELKPDDIQSRILPLVHRLRSGEWATARASASSLLALPYAIFPPPKRQILLDAYMELVSDSESVVRRAAASNFPALCGAAAQVSDEVALRGSLASCLKKIVADEQDCIRLLVPPALIAIAKALRSTRDGATAVVVPLAEAVLADKSWRVRYVLAGELADLMGAFAKDQETVQQLSGHFVRLLSDAEPEVLLSACSRVCAVAKELGKQVAAKSLLPALVPLAEHENDSVRSSVAACLSEVAPYVPPATLDRDIAALLAKLLRDPESDVRLSVIANIGSVMKASPTAVSSQVVPAVVSLLQDPKWRVRYATAPHLSVLAEHLTFPLFSKDLLPALLACLRDRVFVIRKLASKLTPTLVKVYGPAVLDSISAATESLLGAESYILRVTGVYTLGQCIRAHPPFVKKAVSLLLDATRDPVPNVRFVALRVISEQRITAEVAPTLAKRLQTLIDDKDPEVRFFAGQAMAVST